jgi:hypothetical protein
MALKAFNIAFFHSLALKMHGNAHTHNQEEVLGSTLYIAIVVSDLEQST